MIMRKDRRFSLADKVALFFIMVFAFGAVGLYYNLRNLQKTELLMSSRLVAKVVDSLISSSAELGGIWATDNKGLKTVATVSGLLESTGDQIDLYRVHDPEFISFVTSLFKDPKAKISLDFKSIPPSGEAWSLKNSVFSYEKPIIVSKACVSCHEASNGAPRLRLGEAAGVIKVNFYDQNLLSLLGESISLYAPLAFLLVTLILYVLVRFELIKPLSELTQKVHEMSLGNLDVDLGVKGISEERSRDEIVKLAISIERLRKSQKTMEKMLDDDSLML
ncbi:HAMP domain-containing protein [Thermodesulfatator autotrophicus]|uniref:HAMP domain-containing protein n=1 Tax=Thermodesulfatator autotrophicus TaxID=1795632 RepID=A0A177E8U2_9BACT|nr:HAMP domain-containing protein [Thermodesulfatator autotrophicus]OAG27632.1 hypothetical protein TH606_05830 [Thermodesulfatator autotrophicus]